MRPGFDVIVLAGGSARRLGGADKPGLLLGDRSLLDRVLDGCTRAGRRVVVGPPRACAYDVVFCQEHPAGSGPVAGVAAGFPYTEAEVVVLLAADMPFVGAAVEDLAGAVPGHDAAVLVDHEGRPQPLAVAYRRAALAAALDRLGDGRGAAMRALLDDLDVVRVPAGPGVMDDCDTWSEVARARERVVAEGTERAR